MLNIRPIFWYPIVRHAIGVNPLALSPGDAINEQGVMGS